MGELRLLSLEKGRVSESDSLQLRILGETLAGSLEKPYSKVEMFNLVFTSGRGGKSSGAGVGRAELEKLTLLLILEIGELEN